MPAGYGLAKPGSRAPFVAWADARRKLIRARNYWVSTTRPDGRPHTMPVWGLWHNDRFYFSTDRGARKALNLRGNPATTVHLESGDDVVIVDGVADEVTDREDFKNLDARYHGKYGIHVIGIPGDVGMYRVTPRVAFAWREKDFNKSATRWRWGGGRRANLEG